MSLRWGIIGTGNIAHTFARALAVAKKGTLVAVGSRSLETAQAFGQEFGVKLCFGSYTELLSCDQVDIVYLCTPHPYHYELALTTVQYRKHMLIEKPMAMTHAQVQHILDAAKEQGLFVMEAYMYRCHPQTLKLVDLIQSGAIGKVKFIRANFSFDGRSLGPSSRLWRNELGGGAILDIGGYPMSFCRLIAGIEKKGIANPTQIKATGYIQPDTKVDEWSNASLAFEDGVTAQVFTGIFSDSDCSVEVLGSEGSVKVNNLWRPDLPQLGAVELEYTKYGQEKEIIPVPLEETNLFAYEADAVAEAVLNGQHECRYMTWEDTVGQSIAMDAWRKEIGLKYKEDN
ncbi:hypothetical protein INT47_012927 [Mucor saturninus]|uniref:D-xylose 1-dehydrogenase (NADP(+), D-xylono-1,5-lactone-forming) n=1 Tax=Mucor saturninus TaxID=64648 RepID=A0A8H7QQ94_9FUNG|nr:hypothetical protein INT47_012927 [Mucor saturninus]